MRDSNFRGFGKAMARTGRGFSQDLPKKELLRANLKFAAVSVAISLIAGWLLGFNVWVLLIAILLQSMYFFGQKTVKNMFVFLFVNLVIILLCGLSYNVLIEQTGLADEWKSRVRHMVTQVGIDLDHPTDSLEAGMQRLVRQRSDKLYRQNKDDFDGLLKSAEEIKRMKNKMYNSINDKTFDQPSSNSSGSQKFTSPQAMFNLQPGETSQQFNTPFGYEWVINLRNSRASDYVFYYNNTDSLVHIAGTVETIPAGTIKFFKIKARNTPISFDFNIWRIGQPKPSV